LFSQNIFENTARGCLVPSVFGNCSNGCSIFSRVGSYLGSSPQSERGRPTTLLTSTSGRLCEFLNPKHPRYGWQYPPHATGTGHCVISTQLFFSGPTTSQTTECSGLPVFSSEIIRTFRKRNTLFSKNHWIQGKYDGGEYKIAYLAETRPGLGFLSVCTNL